MVSRSEEHKLFPDVTDNFMGGDFKDIEVDCFCEGSALADDSDVTDFNAQGWRTVSG